MKNYNCSILRGEKRDLDEIYDANNKRIRIETEDLGEETVAEVVATITDPRQMVGPEVLFSENAARDEAAKVSILCQFTFCSNF